MTLQWTEVADRLDAIARSKSLADGTKLKDGQRAALLAICERLRRGQRAALLADEVGMGKTLIAAALIKSVQRSGGRAAIIIPPGLGAQWQSELRRFDIADHTLSPLRSYWAFIQAYARAEHLSDRQLLRERRERELADRRLQLQLPSGAWAEEPLLLLSHTLGRLVQTEGTETEYQALLEAILKVHAGTRAYRRDPNIGAFQNVARAAAERILAGLPHHEQQRLCEGLTHRTSDLRTALCLAMGRALGKFDLIVIDEAHKTRGAKSSLSRVLDTLIWKSETAFHLGMTATPVELDPDQWTNTLARLGVQSEHLTEMTDAIQRYDREVQNIQADEALTLDLVNRYTEASRALHSALAPWVLRRDKREDDLLKRFAETCGSHREIIPIEVPISKMPLAWRRMFLTSEALSQLHEERLSPQDRRMRLSLPSGRSLRDAAGEMARLQAFDDELMQADSPSEPIGPWQRFSRELLGGEGTSLFDHPAVVRTAEEIELAVRAGHKVLVFGRFIKPMRALTFLLDAREMVRRLCADDKVENRWPQAGLGELDSEREAALKAALRDPAVNTRGLDRDAVDKTLRERASRFETARRANLEAMRRELADDPEVSDLREFWLADAGRRDGNSALLAALEDQRSFSERHQHWTKGALLAAFRSLVAEITSGDQADDSDIDVKARLTEHLFDFAGREGHFARLMYGNTAPQTRRLLQAAFNREGSWPQVLVAQSMVGREGLNLHQSCRMVVLLHLEWNPAHVEQQIGRVDRINSKWSREAEAYLESGDVSSPPPRIVIRPVIISGSYDDHHWSVLKRRWDGMRAQLNGDIIPEADADASDPERRALFEKIRAVTPNFAPPPMASPRRRA
ncbi:DEAD/DEAH box helicase family protein [Sphingopyxis sp. MG]|uniref:DEAD/DEAH box helicase family protein n=1 Tax=Sphingopyxis sp. MG TaxID=1866325 RepID=UPI000CDF48F1|nr:DEAD/DEAH box helicase family protein [Sphingopyxis sp. MG]AVA13499.1 helicase [Sphingopyxis sp. MG]